MNPKNYVQVDYDGHAAFRVDGSETIRFERIQGEVDRLNELYGFSAENGARLPKRIQAQYSQELLSVLDSIFEKLLAFNHEGHVALFYKDLRKHSSRVLLDDLRFFFRPRNYKGGYKRGFDQEVALSGRKFFTGKIKPDAVSELLGVAQADVERFRRNLEAGKFKREDLSVNVGPKVKEVIGILNQAYGEMGILDAVSFYQGESTHVGGCAIELSSEQTRWWTNIYEEYPEDTRAAYFHLDEGLDAPKSILYLTDTDVANGATGVVPEARAAGRVSPLQSVFGRVINYVGTAPDSDPELRDLYKQKYHVSLSSPVKRRHFMTLPAELRFNSHFGFDVIPGSDQEKNLVESEIKIVGPAGTFLVFDGAQLLHRGGLVQKGSRIALQIIFTKNESFMQKVKRKSKGWISKTN